MLQGERFEYPSAYRVSSNRLLVALLTGLEALPRLRGSGEGALREPPVVPTVRKIIGQLLPGGTAWTDDGTTSSSPVA